MSWAFISAGPLVQETGARFPQSAGRRRQQAAHGLMIGRGWCDGGGPLRPSARKRPPLMRRLHRVRLTDVNASLHRSIGDIAFGMEDGAVSIAGLVFGVAAGSGDSHIVLLAGVTGATAGAVSMMAGTYLAAHSTEDRARAQVAALKARVEADPGAELAVMGQQLRRAGLTEDEIAVVTRVSPAIRVPWARYAAAFEFGRGQQTGESPVVHALGCSSLTSWPPRYR